MLQSLYMFLYTHVWVSPGCVPRSAITEWEDSAFVGFTRHYQIALQSGCVKLHLEQRCMSGLYKHQTCVFGNLLKSNSFPWILLRLSFMFIGYVWFLFYDLPIHTFWPFFICVFLFWFGEVFKYILIKKLPTMQETPRQRSLVGYSAWGREESVTTEWLHHHHQH